MAGPGELILVPIFAGFVILGRRNLARVVRERRALNTAARRLGFTIRKDLRVDRMGARDGGSVRHPQARGEIAGYEVRFDQLAKLRIYDRVERGDIRVSVRFERLPINFRVVPEAYARTGSLELLDMPGLRVECDEPHKIERILTPSRRRVLVRMHALWPLIDVRHNRLIAVVNGVEADADAIVDAVHLMAQAGKAFHTGRYSGVGATQVT